MMSSTIQFLIRDFLSSIISFKAEKTRSLAEEETGVARILAKTANNARRGFLPAIPELHDSEVVIYETFPLISYARYMYKVILGDLIQGTAVDRVGIGTIQ